MNIEYLSRLDPFLESGVFDFEENQDFWNVWSALMVYAVGIGNNEFVAIRKEHIWGLPTLFDLIRIENDGSMTLLDTVYSPSGYGVETSRVLGNPGTVCTPYWGASFPDCGIVLGFDLDAAGGWETLSLYMFKNVGDQLAVGVHSFDPLVEVDGGLSLGGEEYYLAGVAYLPHGPCIYATGPSSAKVTLATEIYNGVGQDDFALIGIDVELDPSGLTSPGYTKPANFVTSQTYNHNEYDQRETTIVGTDGWFDGWHIWSFDPDGKERWIGQIGNTLENEYPHVYPVEFTVDPVALTRSSPEVCVTDYPHIMSRVDDNSNPGRGYVDLAQPYAGGVLFGTPGESTAHLVEPSFDGFHIVTHNGESWSGKQTLGNAWPLHDTNLWGHGWADDPRVYLTTLDSRDGDTAFGSLTEISILEITPGEPAAMESLLMYGEEGGVLVDPADPGQTGYEHYGTCFPVSDTHLIFATPTRVQIEGSYEIDNTYALFRRNVPEMTATSERKPVLWDWE